MLLVVFAFIPYEILDYNLGINLISESIGILITIVFLSWLFSLRKKKEWKIVKDEVYNNIQENLSAIIDGIFAILDKDVETWMSLLSIEDWENRSKALFTELCKLRDAKEIRINPLKLKVFLVDRESRETFLTVAKQLSDIQIKYSRFLDPKLTIALMKIQRSIFLLERTSYLHNLLKKTSEEIPKQLREIFPPQNILLPEELYTKSVSLAFKELIEQIYNLHAMGIKLRLI